MNRLFTVLTSVAVIAAVGVGAAVAADYGPKSGHGGVKKAKAANSAYLSVGPDRNATGAALLQHVGGNTVCYGFTLRRADTPTVVHIHKGRAGQTGDPVITFANVPKGKDGAPSGDPGASSGCKVLTDAGEIAALVRIKAKPYRYYVNIHTEKYPDGAVRGQLSRLTFDNN